MNKQLVSRVFQSNAGLAGLALRLPVGIVLAAHGAQKLFGWFGGYGLEGTGQWMASIGLEPGYLMALLAGGGRILRWSGTGTWSVDSSRCGVECIYHAGGYL